MLDWHSYQICYLLEIKLLLLLLFTRKSDSRNQEILIRNVVVRQYCKSKGGNVKFSKFIGRFLVA